VDTVCGVYNFDLVFFRESLCIRVYILSNACCRHLIPIIINIRLSVVLLFGHSAKFSMLFHMHLYNRLFVIIYRDSHDVYSSTISVGFGHYAMETS